MKEKLLLLLKQYDTYLSGEKIGEILGISRTAVWKYINALRKDGYDIKAVTNRGYILKKNSDVLSKTEIIGIIKTRSFAKKIEFYDEVVSTNDIAKVRAADGEKEGTLVLADAQSGGKGRHGRVWKSPKGSGIWMSVILRPKIDPWSVSSITLVAGLAVCKALINVTGLEAGIKWPNDILINGKKVCGILTEMSAQMESVEFVISGIGINVNTESFPEEIEDTACSLYTIAGKRYDRNQIVCAVWQEFEPLYSDFCKNGFGCVKEEYERYCVNIGKNVHVLAKENFDAFVLGVNDRGELRVRKENGEETVVFSGEVSIRNAQ